MSNPYVGEIRMFGGNFAPQDWAFCNGQMLSISDYDTLFNLIGTTYGGDGQNTFAVPDLRGRIPVHVGSSLTLAQAAGSETVSLLGPQTPVHDHTFNATTTQANAASPSGALMGKTDQPAYVATTTTPGVPMAPQSIGPTGGGAPHDNMMPFLAVSFIISLFGIYPSQS